MDWIVEKYAELPKPLRRPLWQWWHRRIHKIDGDSDVNFMNYGYEKLNGDPRLELQNIDEANRYSIQLYDHVVRSQDLKGKEMLEVGSGRGGGASYIARYFEPEKYTGLDISKRSIDYCNSHYLVDNLSFVCGYAEDLPFDDASFDYVVNVESARCYKDMQQFFNQVYRVLKPGGKLLIADIIYPKELEVFNERIINAGFKIQKETDISANVVESLKKDSKRREGLILQKVPKIFNSTFLNFAATEGKLRYNNLNDGTFSLWSFVLEK